MKKNDPARSGKYFFGFLAGSEHGFNCGEKKLKPNEFVENIHRRLFFGDYGFFFRVMIFYPQARKQYEQNYEHSAQNMVVFYKTGQ
jgi:hypothetical protein